MPRPPRTALEILTANSRPQPAIPAVLVLLLCGLFAGYATQAGSSSVAAWALTAGLLLSCGLAVAAGFCSVFPTLAWIGLAALLFGTHRGINSRPRQVAPIGWFAGQIIRGWQIIRRVPIQADARVSTIPIYGTDECGQCYGVKIPIAAGTR